MPPSHVLRPPTSLASWAVNNTNSIVSHDQRTSDSGLGSRTPGRCGRPVIAKVFVCDTLCTWVESATAEVAEFIH